MFLTERILQGSGNTTSAATRGWWNSFRCRFCAHPVMQDWLLPLVASNFLRLTKQVDQRASDKTGRCAFFFSPR